MPFFIPALLIVQLPAEWRVPLFHVLSFGVTNLELAAYLLIAVGAWRAVRRPRPFDALDWAAAAWLAAVFASGLAAPERYADAARAGARLVAGPLCFLLLRGALPPAARARAAQWLAWSGAAAATVGIVEAAFPAMDLRVLLAFKAKATTSAFGLRASGTFEHANQFSQFLEIAAVAFGAAAAAAAPRRLPWLGALPFMLGWGGVLAAMSRAGWLAAGAASAAALALGRRNLRRPSAFALALLTAGLAGASVFLAPRLRYYTMGAAGRPPFAARLSFQERPRPAIVAANLGSEPWAAAGRLAVRLSVHGRQLAPVTREAEVFLPLTRDVPPGASAFVAIDPARTLPDGRYLHVYDLLHPAYGYASQWDVTPVSGVTVVRRGRAVLSYGERHGPLRRALAGRGELWSAAWAAFRSAPVLGLGPGQYQVSYPRWLPAVEADPRLHPNDLYLHVLAEEGAIGGLAYLAVLVFAARALLRGARRPAGHLAAAGAGALAAWILHGIFDSFLLFNGCGLAFWVMLAIACPPGVPGPRGRSAP